MRKFIVRVGIQIKTATFYSIDGFRVAFKEEFAFSLEMLLALFALPAAFFIGHTALERAVLIASYLLIPIIELLNSGIETTLNRIDTTWNPLTKKAKDIGSAAVMLSIINATIVWLILIFSHDLIA